MENYKIKNNDDEKLMFNIEDKEKQNKSTKCYWYYNLKFIKLRYQLRKTQLYGQDILGILISSILLSVGIGLINLSTPFSDTNNNIENDVGQQIFLFFIPFVVIGLLWFISGFSFIISQLTNKKKLFIFATIIGLIGSMFSIIFSSYVINQAGYIKSDLNALNVCNLVESKLVINNRNLMSYLNYIDTYIQKTLIYADDFLYKNQQSNYCMSDNYSCDLTNNEIDNLKSVLGKEQKTIHQGPLNSIKNAPLLIRHQIDFVINVLDDNKQVKPIINTTIKYLNLITNIFQLPEFNIFTSLNKFLNDIILQSTDYKNALIKGINDGKQTTYKNSNDDILYIENLINKELNKTIDIINKQFEQRKLSTIINPSTLSVAGVSFINLQVNHQLSELEQYYSCVGICSLGSKLPIYSDLNNGLYDHTCTEHIINDINSAFTYIRNNIKTIIIIWLIISIYSLIFIIGRIFMVYNQQQTEKLLTSVCKKISRVKYLKEKQFTNEYENIKFLE